MWVRGLKHPVPLHSVAADLVAPYVGAWIETRLCSTSRWPTPVAPYVGAWIETISFLLRRTLALVAPYVGAWIETVLFVDGYKKRGRTLCGCVD